MCVVAVVVLLGVGIPWLMRKQGSVRVSVVFAAIWSCFLFVFTRFE